MTTLSAEHVLVLDESQPDGRAVLRLHGDDVERFLQGILSADISGLEPGKGIPASLLSVKGKLVCDAIVLKDADGGIVLCVPHGLAQELVERIDRHIIMDDVQISHADGLSCAIGWGEGSVVHLPASVMAVEVSYPVPGTLFVGPLAELKSIGGTEISVRAAFDTFRVTRGCPAWGFEVEEGRFPPEVGFVSSVSYDKGCYLGQEPLARIHARGQVNWVMVQVNVQGGEPDARGGELRLKDDSGEGAVVGTLTTRVAGELQGCNGLAIVKRKVVSKGTELALEGGGEAVVHSDPLGTDEGIGGKGKSATVQLGKKR